MEIRGRSTSSRDVGVAVGSATVFCFWTSVVIVGGGSDEVACYDLSMFRYNRGGAKESMGNMGKNFAAALAING